MVLGDIFNSLISITIVVVFLFIVYIKLRKQTIKEAIEDIKGLLGKRQSAQEIIDSTSVTLKGQRWGQK